jgi:Flp pilus assembly protein CpaB
MRTVWLTLFCLIGLATAVLAKIISPFVSADVSRSVPFAKAEVSRETSSTDTVVLSSENVTAGTKLQNDRWTKADELDVSYTNEAPPELKSVKSVVIGSPTTEPKQVSNKKMERMVSRHWHDPFDEGSVPAAARAPAKRKASNTSTSPSPKVTARTKVLIRSKGAPVRL